MDITPFSFWDLFVEKIKISLGKKTNNASYITCDLKEVIDTKTYKNLKKKAELFKDTCLEGDLPTNKTKDFLFSKFPNSDLNHIENKDPILELAHSKNLLELISKNFHIRNPYPAKANYWWIPPLKGNTKRQRSQNWHIDPEGKKVIKVFIYFNDVFDSCMQMIPTVRRSNLVRLYSKMAIRSYGLYPDNRQKKIIEYFSDDIISFTLKEGQILIADTSHIHRGGYSFKEGRLSCVITYKPNR